MCVCASMCVKRAKEFPFLASSRVCNSQRSSGEADKCLPTLRPTSDIINIATVSKCRTFRTASGGAVNTDAAPRRTSPFFLLLLLISVLRLPPPYSSEYKQQRHHHQQQQQQQPAALRRRRRRHRRHSSIAVCEGT